jgi:multiple sugar transport system substrate-binding protein
MPQTPIATLRGMTWNHPRATLPLQAAAPALAQAGVQIDWDARSLQGFEEASIADLAADYDLIAIDHPFMGKAHEQGALLPIDELLDETFLAQLAAASVGASYESYRWRGHIWAVPVDAAAQVAAMRADLLSADGLDVPRTWNEVFDLAGSLPGGVKAGMPANPTHMLLAYATICHAVAPDEAPQPDLRPAWWGDDGIDPAVALAALDVLSRFMGVAHPLSWNSDPIEMFEHMSRASDLAYVPIAFGYSNYARPPAGRAALSFAGVPSSGRHIIGGMLGGVGLAVSHRCRNREAAAIALRLLADEPMQRGDYALSGGQPAHRAAWTDARVNTACPNFFDTTLESLDHAFVRPRLPAYPRFQREGGLLLHALMREKAAHADIAARLNACWRRLRNADTAAQPS